MTRISSTIVNSVCRWFWLEYWLGGELDACAFDRAAGSTTSLTRGLLGS